MTVLLLLDFSKAFDNIVHSFLCSKLSSLFRFHGTAVELIRSYLSDRYQCVYVDGKISDLVLVARGVVQSSVLEPLLFSLFITDITSRISHCRYHLYAYDVQLYLSGDIDSISDCISRMNLDLESLYKWTIENDLCLNPKKTQAMIINYPSSVAADAPAIYLAGQQVPYSKSVKDLGLVLNNAFSWENQVNLICRRVYFALRRLWSTTAFTPVGTRRKLALSLVAPLFFYCDVVDMCTVFQDVIIFLIMLTPNWNAAAAEVTRWNLQNRPRILKKILECQNN
jgi:hypothetical protein